MAWDASGRWIKERRRKLLSPTTPTTPVEQAPVDAQASTVTGLLSRRDARRARREDRPDEPVTPPGTTPTPPGTPPVPGTGAGTTTPPAPPAVPPAGQPYSLEPPTLADASVETRLTGLLNADSSYMQAARKGGIRTAARRGLLNSSIAAGAGEAAAIAAAAPIASQDAAQIHAANQSRLEANLQFGNATRLQAQQDATAMARQLEAQKSQASLQQAELKAAMERLGIQVAAEKDIAAKSQSNALTQTQINANSNLIGNYLSAFGAMAQNPEIPAATREAYIAEMKTVISQGMGFATKLAGSTVTWGANTTPAPTATTRTTASAGRAV